MRRSRPFYVVALTCVALLAATVPCLAANWQLVGESGPSLEKVMVDLDSVKSVDGFRVVAVMKIMTSPSTTKDRQVMDRTVTYDAFDCGQRRYIGVRTVGYLGEKQVGTSPQMPQWQVSMIPIPSNGVAQRVFAVACSASGGPPIGGAAPAAQAKVFGGSGMFVDADGYVLTAAHVVKGCQTITVQVPRMQPVAAAVEAMDPKNDLALIKTAAGYGEPALFRPQSRPVRLGEAIGVVGYPLPGLLSIEPKATFGQINSVAGINNDYTLLQISAPVQPGNSGGPVFDESGGVVGVIVSELSPLVAARIGVPPQNVNFAIRGELAQIFMTAHGVPYEVDNSRRRLETDVIAAQGEKSTAQIVCVRP